MIPCICACHKTDDIGHQCWPRCPIISEEQVDNKTIEAWREYVTELFGPRCKTKDTDDFPELKESSCPACLAWEQFDNKVKELNNEKK